MEDELKHHKKKRSKKASVEDEDDGPSRDSRGFEALAELTSSDVIRQVKAGLSRIAPLEPESEEDLFTPPDDLDHQHHSL